MQNKKPLNSEGQRHGHWEVYHSNGQLDFKGLFINGTRFGKHESYWTDGSVWYIANYINHEYYGYYKYNKDKEYYAK